MRVHQQVLKNVRRGFRQVSSKFLAGVGRCHGNFWRVLAGVSRRSGRCGWQLCTLPALAQALTRLGTSVCQPRHDQMEQGPTEPQAGRSTFLLSSGSAGGAGITKWLLLRGRFLLRTSFPAGRYWHVWR